MPLIILVAEASDRILAGFLEVDLRSHADGCNPSDTRFLAAHNALFTFFR
jgi:hypothetical protein